jgi:dCMP deaminase
MIIGLTGKNASGKGEVAEYLKSRGFTFYSLSDVLRDELRKKKKVASRDNLIWLGNKLRDEQGPSVLADKILEQVQDDRHYVIDSFRNPEEVKAFKRTKDFLLLSVEASEKKRFERLQRRNREHDSKSFEEFVAHEKKELNSSDPTKQNLRACAAMSDFKIPNNGSIDELHTRLNRFFSKILMHAPRPSWDEYFMKIAGVVASRSNCMKRKVAALIVADGRIISTGYNGTPRGVKNCNEGGCPRCNSFSPSGKGLSECFCSHAEENAIVQASYHGISIKGAIIYTTFSPCLMCTKMIINSGLTEVVYNQAYPLGDEALSLLKQPHIRVRKFSK